MLLPKHVSDDEPTKKQVLNVGTVTVYKWLIGAVIAISALPFVILLMLSYKARINNAGAPLHELMSQETMRTVALPSMDWKAIIEPSPTCAEDPPFVVLMVISKPTDMYARSVVRRTWGRNRELSGRKIRTFFILGRGKTDEQDKRILDEGAAYGDIVQRDFIENYRSLAIKDIAMIRWVASSCAQVEFMVKIDVDILLNQDILMRILESKRGLQNVAVGLVLYQMPPVREHRHPNFESRGDFPFDHYPNYLSGGCYILSSDVVAGLSTATRDVPLLSNEDVYIGVCLDRLGISPEDISENDASIDMWLTEESSACYITQLLAGHNLKLEKRLALWRWVQAGGNAICKGKDQ